MYGQSIESWATLKFIELKFIEIVNIRKKINPLTILNASLNGQKSNYTHRTTSSSHSHIRNVHWPKNLGTKSDHFPTGTWSSKNFAFINITHFNCYMF